MNAQRIGEQQGDHDAIQNTARALYQEAFHYVVGVLQSKKEKTRDRLEAAAIIMATAWPKEPHS